MRRHLTAAVSLALGAALLSATAAQAEPEPGSPEYVERDTRNIADAYGRIHGEGGQLQNPAYLPALVMESTFLGVDQLLQQVATPNRLAITPGNTFPGWNVGNPLRAEWDGTRGRMKKVAFTNRYGALLRGHVYAPLSGAKDPYTGRKLKPPYPGVVITTGSVQASEGMYEWLAQDLAERGYVAITYDVQGQGTSESLPHDGGPVNAVPFCNPFASPEDGESFGCPGVPSQQLSNFVVGTRDALSFFTSTPDRHYRNPQAGDTPVDEVNPFWRLFDRSPDRRTETPGRTSRIAIIGHSMGAAAVSKVQELDRRVATVVAFDKLQGNGAFGPGTGGGNKPVVPALAIQSEYGFEPTPWWLSGESSLAPQPSPGGPDPMRERRTGYEAWRKAGVDSMLLVPRASTHLEYHDIPLVLPASRYGQAFSGVYVQRWLDRYLKHRGGIDRLLDRQFRYLEPVGDNRWEPVTLERNRLLSFYYCSAYGFDTARGAREDGDVTGVGCRKP